ncbi:MAG: hypothetical protein M0T80_06380 [Actinomycetota bacterium]|nr:hypothetical protein [Actinomycetota bacterium]
MSNNVLETARLSSQVLAQLLGAEMVGLSERLAGLAAGRLGGDTLGVLGEPGVARLAEQAGLGAELAGVLLDARSGQTLEAESTVRLAEDLGAALQLAERTALAELTAGVLAEHLGYRVTLEVGEAATGIEAWRGDEVVLVAVSNAERLELLIDQAGAPDCAGGLAALEEALCERGVILERLGEAPHEPEDGPLIARAAATGEASLATGIARHARVASNRSRPRAERELARPQLETGLG